MEGMRRIQRPSAMAVKFAFLIAIFGMVHGLRNVRLIVPSYIKGGSTTIIVCHYDLEGDSLYSVKWYKGRREFFRYTPKEDPSIKVFPIHRLYVDQRRSNASQVVLRHVTPANSGRYSCEVSADAPSFHTALVSGDMDVVYVPKGRPSITGVKPRYRTGETLTANCSSTGSRPPANLTWAINGQTANLAYVTHFPHSPVEGDDSEAEENRRMSSTVGLRFDVASHHFVGGSAGGGGGKLKVRCTASMHGLFWQSTEKSVEEERARMSVGSPQAVEEETMRGKPKQQQHYGGGILGMRGVELFGSGLDEEERRSEGGAARSEETRRRKLEEEEALEEEGLDGRRRRKQKQGGKMKRKGVEQNTSSGPIGSSLATTIAVFIVHYVSVR